MKSCRGFNEALNGLTEEGWSMLGNDGADDITILVNSSPSKIMGFNATFANGFPTMNNAVLCAKASMLLQVVLYNCFYFSGLSSQYNTISHFIKYFENYRKK